MRYFIKSRSRTFLMYTLSTGFVFLINLCAGSLTLLYDREEQFPLDNSPLIIKPWTISPGKFPLRKLPYGRLTPRATVLQKITQQQFPPFFLDPK